MRNLFTRAPAVFTGAAALLAGGLMAAPASAQGEAETMMVLGGYTNYTVSFTKFPGGGDADTGPRVEIAEQEGDIYIYNNTEIFFNGSAETDGGLQVSARVELEGGASADPIDEHYITVSGGFGKVEIGANDSADEQTAKGIFYNSTGVDYWYTNTDVTPTAGYRGLGQNDGMGVVYTTPSLGGASFAIGYKPSMETSGNDGYGDENLFAFGAKYDGDMGGITFGGSFGYHTHEGEISFEEVTDTTPDALSTTDYASDVTVWGIGGELGFGDTTLYARYQDEETELQVNSGFDVETKIAALAISHVLGPIKLGLGWVQATRTEPNIGLRMVDAAGGPVTPNYTDTATPGEEMLSAGELENEDTMLIGSVDYTLGSGVTLGGYVAWGETEQKGAIHDIDIFNGGSAIVPNGDTGPAKDSAASDSGTAFGVALNLAF